MLDNKLILDLSRSWSLPSSHLHCISRAGSPQDPKTAPAHIPAGQSQSLYTCDWRFLSNDLFLQFCLFSFQQCLLLFLHTNQQFKQFDLTKFATCWVQVPVTIGSSVLMLKLAPSSANLFFSTCVKRSYKLWLIIFWQSELCTRIMINIDDHNYFWITAPPAHFQCWKRKIALANQNRFFPKFFVLTNLLLKTWNGLFSFWIEGARGKLKKNRLEKKPCHLQTAW